MVLLMFRFEKSINIRNFRFVLPKKKMKGIILSFTLMLLWQSDAAPYFVSVIYGDSSCTPQDVQPPQYVASLSGACVSSEPGNFRFICQPNATEAVMFRYFANDTACLQPISKSVVTFGCNANQGVRDSCEELSDEIFVQVGTFQTESECNQVSPNPDFLIYYPKNYCGPSGIPGQFLSYSCNPLGNYVYSDAQCTREVSFEPTPTGPCVPSDTGTYFKTNFCL